MTLRDYKRGLVTSLALSLMSKTPAAENANAVALSPRDGQDEQVPPREGGQRKTNENSAGEPRGGKAEKGN